MLLFIRAFPDVAARETRSAEVHSGNSFGVPEDSYAFAEWYCEEKGCDCRRVMLSVMAGSTLKEVARISHGFDPPRGVTARLGQTYLEPFGPQAPYAMGLLNCSVRLS